MHLLIGDGEKDATQPGVGWFGSCYRELIQGLSQYGRIHLSHHCYLPRSALAENWGQEPTFGSTPTCPNLQLLRYNFQFIYALRGY